MDPVAARFVNLLLIVVLAAALAGTAREWLVLRGRVRQRGLFRRWPVPRVSLEAVDARFAPGEFGPTREAEVWYLGRGTLRVSGGTSDTEAWILATLARGTRHLFEFGTGTGKTAYLWARNQPAGGTVTTLTIAPEQFGAYRSADGDSATAERYARSEARSDRFLYTGTDVEGRITQLFGDSKSFDESAFAGQCDLVFVDGSHAHSYVVSDSAKAIRMARPGGLVLWHDYSPECPGVFRALNELRRERDLKHIQGTTLVAWRAPEGAGHG